MRAFAFYFLEVELQAVFALVSQASPQVFTQRQVLRVLRATKQQAFL